VDDADSRLVALWSDGDHDLAGGVRVSGGEHCAGSGVDGVDVVAELALVEVDDLAGGVAGGEGGGDHGSFGRVEVEGALAASGSGVDVDTELRCADRGIGTCGDGSLGSVDAEGAIFIETNSVGDAPADEANDGGTKDPEKDEDPDDNEDYLEGAAATGGLDGHGDWHGLHWDGNIGRRGSSGRWWDISCWRWGCSRRWSGRRSLSSGRSLDGISAGGAKGAIGSNRGTTFCTEVRHGSPP
jgi:hypothetical protein